MISTLSRAILAVAVTAYLTVASAAFADDKRDNIREIIRVTGTLDIVDQLAGPMFEQFAEAFAAVNPGAGDQLRVAIADELQQVFRDNIGDLEEMTVLAYDAHFDAAEIAALLEFYLSPLGQRLIEETPNIVRESQAAGMAWGRALGHIAFERVVERLENEGFETPS